MRMPKFKPGSKVVLKCAPTQKLEVVCAKTYPRRTEYSCVANGQIKN